MEAISKDNLNSGKKMDQGNLISPTKGPFKDNFITTKWMVKENIHGMMEKFILEKLDFFISGKII